MGGISKSQVSRLCEEIDERVKTFLEPPIEGDWPYLWIDATYVKVRQNGRIVSVAVTIAVAVNTDGRREVLGMDIGASEAETFWIEFLRKLKRRGLAGVKLVISDAHEGIKAAVSKVFRATWQRCRVHFMRNALAHAGRSGRRVVSAFIATAFAQDDAGAAKAQWRQVADQVRPKLPKLATLLDEVEEDVLAFMTFPKEHRAKIHSTNPLERLNGEIKRRTEVVGIFPNSAGRFGSSAATRRDTMASGCTASSSLTTSRTTCSTPPACRSIAALGAPRPTARRQRARPRPGRPRPR
ncbi:mutator family transposase [Azospirillum brasilense]|uniref:Mutator family transposase n=1 Tax=Azospirillum brasilense TaxID=192 RepID=A0A560AE14_AZOBR|nr:mutator family transposase [Azospirillum brasilense]